MADQAGPASPTAITQPVNIAGQPGEHWWQAIPRKLSLTSSWTRTRSFSENEAENTWNGQGQAVSTTPTSLTALWNRTRTRSISESSESEHHVTAPSFPTPSAVIADHGNEPGRGRRYSEASASGDRTAEIRARWNRCSNDLPRESFVPPWI